MRPGEMLDRLRGRRYFSESAGTNVDCKRDNAHKDNIEYN
jgi:hypothetical protein